MTSTNLLHKVEMTFVVSYNQEFVHRRNGENVKVLLIAGILHLRLVVMEVMEVFVVFSENKLKVNPLLRW